MGILVIMVILSLGFGAVAAASRALRSFEPRDEPEPEREVLQPIDAWDEEPTRPIPHETQAETTARWLAAQRDGVPVATSDRPTKNIRRRAS